MKRPYTQFLAALELAGWCLPRRTFSDLTPPSPDEILKWSKPPYNPDASLALVDRRTNDMGDSPAVQEVLRAYGLRPRAGSNVGVYVRDLIEHLDLER